MESRMDGRSCRPVVVGFVDGEKKLGNDLEEHVRITFRVLCERLDPYLRKYDTCFRVTVPVQEMIAMSLHSLGSDDGWQSIRDLYGVHKSTLSKIVREFCRVIRKHLPHVFIYLQANHDLGFWRQSLSNDMVYFIL